MRKKVLFVLGLSILIFLTFSFLDYKQITFYKNIFIKLFDHAFDYVHINTEDNMNFDTPKIFKINDIINYQYRNLYYKNNKVDKQEIPVIKEDELPNNNIKDELEPIVYIYNTHHKEEYFLDKSSAHNVIPTVMTTSYMLKEQLENYNIGSIVEESSVSEVLKKNNWNYASSYKVTKTFLENAKKKNPTLKFFIDVHRDSVKKSISTIEINGKSFAKILFVLGLENKNYKQNLKMIEYINNKVNEQYPKLSRGIYKKQGPGVNGVYNQDFSKNCILIEFGAEENTLEEVYNTVVVVSRILADYIGDYNED